MKDRTLFLSDAFQNARDSEKCRLYLAKRVAERSSTLVWIAIVVIFFMIEKFHASIYFSVHSKQSFRQIFLANSNCSHIHSLCYSDIYWIFSIFEEKNTMTSNNITYSASAVDYFNCLRGSILEEKLSVHDHSSDDYHQLTIKYEKSNRWTTRHLNNKNCFY